MNMGPNHDGRLMPIFQEKLLQMGKIIVFRYELVQETKHCGCRIYN